MEKEPTPGSDQKTILIVDDDPHNLDSLAALLLDRHYKVLRAGSGAEACLQSKDYKNEIDLLLANFQMAEVSGVDLANKIRSERPHLKVLLMSMFTAGMLVLNEGWHFLAKPHVHAHLRALIGELLSRSEAPGVNPQPVPVPVHANGSVRPVRRRTPTAGKLPPASASGYRRQSPPAAGRRSRGPLGSSR
jgi:DNA-binding response OmpR family regulator